MLVSTEKTSCPKHIQYVFSLLMHTNVFEKTAGSAYLRAVYIETVRDQFDAALKYERKLAFKAAMYVQQVENK